MDGQEYLKVKKEGNIKRWSREKHCGCMIKGGMGEDMSNECWTAY